MSVNTVLFHRREDTDACMIALIRGCDRRRFIRRVPCQAGVSCSSVRSCVPEFRLGEVMISQPDPWHTPTETSLTALTFNPLLFAFLWGGSRRSRVVAESLVGQPS